jgi:hypothetical protein
MSIMLLVGRNASSRQVFCACCIKVSVVVVTVCAHTCGSTQACLASCELNPVATVPCSLLSATVCVNFLCDVCVCVSLYVTAALNCLSLPRLTLPFPDSRSLCVCVCVFV